MQNTFYTNFDSEIIDGPRTSDYRTPFQQDRDRILHTSAFRRLQAKTQVFKSGEYDFYRTRLTHTIEVAQIGRSICSWLSQHKPLSSGFFIDADLVEACCLAHDIGHPPFGHSGERTLNRVMRRLGGFEGNAQTLRLVSETLFTETDRRRGMSPTRAFLDGILKRKDLVWNSSPEGPKTKFLYMDQARYVDLALGGYGGEEERRRKSIECEIMDWADDTAYCLGDLVDGVRAKFITPSKLEVWAQDRPELMSDSYNDQSLRKLIDVLKHRTLSRFAAVSVGEFVQASSLEEAESSMNGVTNRYRYRLQVAIDAKKQYSLLHTIVRDLVFRTAEVQQLELKADMMLRRIFFCYSRQYLHSKNLSETMVLLPVDTHRQVTSLPACDTQGRARLICDHIAGMSDEFAIRTYRRLFESGFGSIVDLI